MQTWRKKGLIYSETHAQVPTVLKLEDQGIFRIYFSIRDADNRSLIRAIDVEIDNPQKIIRTYKDAFLSLGKLGTFDVNGTMPSCLVEHPKYIDLFYTGWSRRLDVPYYNLIGVARSFDRGLTFNKLGEGPLLGPTLQEPGFIGTCAITRRDQNWDLYYSYCTEWVSTKATPEPKYRINVATSDTYLEWPRNNIPAIDYASFEEGGIVKPTLFKTDTHHMWYSYRSYTDYRNSNKNSYKIGYASSTNGLCWERKDNIKWIGSSNWDSDMQAYPCVVSHNNKLLLFYNGNGFGATGFGYAELADL